MIISEGTVYGVRYYTAQPFFGAHIQTWYNQEWNDMLTWCVKTYGPTPEDGIWTPGAHWYANNAKFWFRDKKDLEWFLLKWE